VKTTRANTVFLVVSLIGFVLCSITGTASAGGDPAADEAQFVALVNQARAAVGVAPLKVDAELTALARAHTQEMANAGTIFHANPISAGVTAPWLKLGENVGTGPSVAPVMTAFINSPGHYANIVDPLFNYIGVGVIWVGNQMFTTHRFMQVEGAVPPPAPPPTAAPTTVHPTVPPPPTTPPTTTPPTTLPPPTTFTPPAASPERIAVVLNDLRSAGL
jgi:hypothetical protein